MPVGKFYEQLELVGNGQGVAGEGPLDADVVVLHELCAWIIQRRGKNDAAATEMKRAPDAGPFPGRLPNTRKWCVPLDTKGETNLGVGWAFAVAIGKCTDDKGEEKVEMWCQTVELVATLPTGQGAARASETA
jgi:hypothetical protein